MNVRRKNIAAIEVVFPTIVLILIAAGAAVQSEPNAFFAIGAATLAVLPFSIAMAREIGSELLAVRRTRREQSLRPLRKDVGAAIVGFLPVLILVGIGFLIEALVTHWMLEKVYAQDPVVASPSMIGCNPDRFICRDGKAGLAMDLETTIDSVEPQLRVLMEQTVTTALLSARRNPASVAELPSLLFEGDPQTRTEPLVPTHLFDVPRSCGIWRWIKDTGECIKRLILKPAHRAWARLRAAAREKLVAIIEEGTRTKATVLDDLESFASIEIGRFVASGADRARLSVQRVDVTASLLDVYLLATLFLAVAKLFLIVLARRIYDVSSAGSGMCLSSSPPPLSDIVAIETRDITRPELDGGGFEYALVPKPDGAVPPKGLYVRYSTGVLQGDVGDGWLYPLGASLRRMMVGSLILYRFLPDREPRMLAIHAERNIRCVQFKLEKDDRIAFDLVDLLAVSDGVRFRTVLSLRLAAFLRCRNFYSVAEGQGHLLLRASGGVTRLRPDAADHTSGRKGSLPIDHLGYDFDGLYCSNALGGEDGMSTQRKRWKRLYGQAGNVFQGGPISPLGETRLVEHAAPASLRRKISVVRRLLFFVLPV